MDELTPKYSNDQQTIMKHLTKADAHSPMTVPANDGIIRWHKVRSKELGIKAFAKRVGRNHETIQKYLA